ncbi:MAG: ABC transporter ATP-binding protein [Candidatus Omnitrophica bacterium]|nr:ABC transporter ATP-binding protein [Candidatus Omnitrophota bacterium]
MSKVNLLIAEKVHKDFPTPEGPLSVLRGVDFSLSVGEMAFIVGRSGSGKSTLLHLLGGLDRATEGRIFFKGNDLSQMNEKELTVYRNLKIGFIFQFFHLLPELTLFENVLLPSLMARRSNRERARDLVRRVGLEGRERHFPHELSGGEQQRAAIARSLVNEPEILFCDEPTGNLDDETAETVFHLLTSLHRETGLALVIVTHDEERAGQFGNISRFHEGVLVRSGTNPVKEST